MHCIYVHIQLHMISTVSDFLFSSSGVHNQEVSSSIAREVKIRHPSAKEEEIQGIYYTFSHSVSLIPSNMVATQTIKDWEQLNWRHFCVMFCSHCPLQELQMKIILHFWVSPTPGVSNDVISGHAHTTCPVQWPL